MNTQYIKNYCNDPYERIMNNYIHLMDEDIENKEDPRTINHKYRIILYCNKKTEFNNTAELYLIEKKACNYYTELTRNETKWHTMYTEKN